MRDVTIVIPSKGENPKYVRRIKKATNVKVIVVLNKQYGDAIKEGIRKASTKYIITMDADGQHTYEEAEKIYKAFKIAGCDLMIGDRRLEHESKLRVVSSTVLNFMASIFARRWVVDLNSGMRIFRRDLALSYESILCDSFSYTTSLAMSHLADGRSVEWFPIKVYDRKHGQSKVKKVRDGLVTVYYIFKIGFALRTRMLRAWIRRFRSRYQL